MSGLFAVFATEKALTGALGRLRQAGLSQFEIYTPMPVQSEPAFSILPIVMLAAGLAGAFGGFFLQSYANVWNYPLDIGGRPRFSWPSFVPIGFEIGVLCAMLAGFAGFLVACRLPHLYDPIDEFPAYREAMRQNWLVSFRDCPRETMEYAREILASLSPALLEEYPT